MNSDHKTIVIDARHVGKVLDGLGRYILELINGLSELPLPNIVILHTSDFPINSISKPGAFIFFKVNIRGGHPKQHIFLPFLIKKLRADVYFYPFIDPPLFSPARKNIFAVHDLNHFFFSPNAATENKIAILMAKIFMHLASLFYNKVIVFSEFVKNQLNSNVPFSKNKTVTIYHGYSPISIDGSIPSPEIINEGISTEKFILYVGNNRPHKNLKRLFDSFELLSKRNKEVSLIIAGHQIPRFFNIDKEIEDKNLEKRVKRLSRPSNNFLVYLYQNALLVVYPSLSEGFGFPILEAWAHKVAIATSFSTCLHEIAGDAAAYFDPLNINDISVTMERVINSKSLRDELIRKGSERLKQFNWNKSAVRHLEIFMNN